MLVAEKCFGLFAILLGLSCPLALALDPPPDQLPFPSYPIAALKNNEEGIVIVEVKFGIDGKVETCHVVRSTATLTLEAHTVSFIKEHWVVKDLAGKTQVVPITYRLSKDYFAMGPETPPPPYGLSVGDSERKLTLRATFREDGWVDRIDVVQASGRADLDHQVEIWIKVHWHSTKYAGQVIDVPFDFKPPPAKKS